MSDLFFILLTVVQQYGKSRKMKNGKEGEVEFARLPTAGEKKRPFSCPNVKNDGPIPSQRLCMWPRFFRPV